MCYCSTLTVEGLAGDRELKWGKQDGSEVQVPNQSNEAHDARPSTQRPFSMMEAMWNVESYMRWSDLRRRTVRVVKNTLNRDEPAPCSLSAQVHLLEEEGEEEEEKEERG